MFLDQIRKRRSIRKYLDQPVEDEKIDLLVEAALRAPTSRDFHPWEFVVVTKPELILRMADAKPTGSAFLKGAPLAMVVLGLPDQSDVWVEDCSIASIFIQLAAESMGLGSCWIQIRKRMHDEDRSAEAYLAGLLGIPDGISVESIIALGYPAHSKSPRTRDELLFEKVHRNGYGTDRSC